MKNNDIKFQETDIIRVYGETIFYRGQDYFDDDRVTSVIDSLISANPSNLMYLGIQAEVGEKTDGNLMEALDKQIESRLQRIMKSNGDDASADELASFIKVNESVLSKEHIFHIIEFLVDNCEDFEESVHDLLDESSYVDFLINCGLTEKARTVIEKSESLDEERKFKLYLYFKMKKGEVTLMRNEIV